MCGIAGLIDDRAKPIEEARLVGVCASMRHRGPDDAGTWAGRLGASTMGLAAVRLAVRDLSHAGHQPMARNDGRHVLVFNGEIYNADELRASLEAMGDRFTSRSDTEVVLAACARWGVDALPLFNGMWALAYFDTQDGCGFLAIDRFGIKPLLYATNGGALAFASEMPGMRMMISGVDRLDGNRIDDGALLHYLRYGYIAAPMSIYAGVRRLPPGSFLAIDERGARGPQRYYQLPTAGPDGVQPDYAEACEHVRELVSRAVARRRVADVPIGAFLSGGVDSAVVVAHLAACSPQPVRTFTIGFKDQTTYDETAHARALAAHFGARHTELRVGVDEVLNTTLDVMNHLGEPFADSSIVPTAMVSRLARSEVTVALSGDGGDELFGGYWRYLAHAALDAYRRIPAWLRRGGIEPLIRAMPSARSGGWTNRVRQVRKLLHGMHADWAQCHVAWSRILSPDAEGILSADAARSRDALADRLAISGNDGDDCINRILAFDLQYGLPGDMLHKVDLASMMHSLEVRVPLLDPELVAYVAPLPSVYKIRRGMRKRLLVDAHSNLLPAEVLSRSKRGFEVPIGEFLRGPLATVFRDTVTPAAIQRFGVLNYDAIERLFEAHRSRRGEFAGMLYALLALCRWSESESGSKPNLTASLNSQAPSVF